MIRIFHPPVFGGGHLRKVFCNFGPVVMPRRANNCENFFGNKRSAIRVPCVLILGHFLIWARTRGNGISRKDQT